MSFFDNPKGSIWKNRTINYNKLLRFPIHPSSSSSFNPKYSVIQIPINNINNFISTRNNLIGKSYAFALNYSKNVGIKKVRIIAIDDLLFKLTRDYRFDRINLRLKSNRHTPFSSTSSQQEALKYVNSHKNIVLVTAVSFG